MKKTYAVASTRVDDGDVYVNYMVHKKEQVPMDTTELVTCIVDYIQNNEIYFKFGPIFHDGVLLFGIIGFPYDHEELQITLSEQIEKHGCYLEIM